MLLIRENREGASAVPQRRVLVRGFSRCGFAIAGSTMNGEPERLKPDEVLEPCGTTEVVPFPNPVHPDGYI